MEGISIRAAARQRRPLSAADVQALEGVIQELEADVNELKKENAWMRSRGLDRAFDALCIKDDDRGRLIQAIHREHAEVKRLRKLCADRPPDCGAHNFEMFHRWLDKIDAAASGEGE